ncbi:alpha/beta hydrolase [Dyella jejuensis]|uniref:Alpha/beta hydrolase n=1 Tax=Dyella jejuensis TaxID=1432009 RepID=A0ABW8JNL7_9GAMM
MRPSWFALFAVVAISGLHAQPQVWQPSPGHTQIPLWPGTPPDAQPVPGPEYATSDPKSLIAGKPMIAESNVSQPTMTIYAPEGKNTGAAVIVFPGGGFQILAMDLEGTEACDWLTSKGITCVLLKYRVPSTPYNWRCNCRPDDFSLSVPALEDAQRALKLVRFHAAERRIDPHKIGVLGFSAGGYLVTEASTNFRRRLYTPVDAADRESSRPDFALAIYPGHLATDKDALNPNVPVSRETPATFLLQAEDDDTDGVNQSLVYYAALKHAGVPVEMHLYAKGGHAFGMRSTANPITHWPELASTWLQTIGILPAR